MQPLSVRLATPDDADKILPLMVAFQKESHYGNLPTEEEIIMETIKDYLNRDRKNTIVVLSVINDVVVGIIVGTSSRLPFNSLIQASETVWYVDPLHRKNTVGTELYEAFEYWAINIAKAQVLHTGAPSGSNLDKVYLSKGYKPLEELYIKVL